MTIWWLSDDYLMTIRWLYDDYPMTICWLSNDYHELLILKWSCLRFSQNTKYFMSHLWMSKCVERVLLRLKHFPHCLHSNTFSVLWIALRLIIMWCFVFLRKKLPRIIMRMNVVSEGRGMYANALIEKKKDDLQKETRGSQEGYTQVETVVKYLKY